MSNRRSLFRLAAAAALGLLAAAPVAPAAQAARRTDDGLAYNFVRFEPIIVTLFDSNRVTGLMSVTLALQVPTPEDKDAIEAQRPRFIDAFNAELSRLGRLHVRPDRPLDVDLLARALETTANRLYGKNRVRALVLDASTRRHG
ncbi:hypothetical protein [Pedomonas sp. V897]|uniref:hypothetical protein n=1 Tax=Pedomonas sp. V897 TaxID=3446482 RepID=UPI003EE16078